MLIHLLIALIILGAILYVVTLLPIDGTVKRIINVVAVVVIIIYVLQFLAGSIHLP